MRLDEATWLEVQNYLENKKGIFIPAGSTEQHGPIGLIGTDALCAQQIAEGAAEIAQALVAPTLAYSPAPFNMAFPGTISISEDLFQQIAEEIVQGLSSQGFRFFYFLNGHGANIAPLKRVAENNTHLNIIIRSWWDYETVNTLRQALYDDWEGMHATPSEVAITQSTHRIVSSPMAETPPKKLTLDYIRAHSGDRHGPPKEHRKQFPDGRVGSHSALAKPEHGTRLYQLAVQEAAKDYAELLAANESGQ